MGRGKIEIKKIENANSRQVTFSKRRLGLFKKAKELAILCDADVALIIFSNTGKLFEFSSSSMKKIISRYKRCLDVKQQVTLEDTDKPEKEQPSETEVLKEEIERLKMKQLRLRGKDLTGMGLPELHALERQLNEGLWCIKERKEKVLMQQLEQCQTKDVIVKVFDDFNVRRIKNLKEQRAVLENETLRKQVEELQTFFPSTSSQTPLCLEYQSTAHTSNPANKECSRSSEMACNSGLGDEESDTTLHLAPPNVIHKKKKTCDGGTQKSSFETRNRLQ